MRYIVSYNLPGFDKPYSEIVYATTSEDAVYQICFNNYSLKILMYEVIGISDE